MKNGISPATLGGLIAAIALFTVLIAGCSHNASHNPPVVANSPTASAAAKRAAGSPDYSSMPPGVMRPGPPNSPYNRTH